MPTRLPRTFALTVIGRLEAATSRLEDMVPNIGDSSPSINGIQSSQAQSLAAIEGMGQTTANGQSSQRHLETLPPVIDSFDGAINGEVKTFVNMSEEIGGLVAEQVCTLSKPFMDGPISVGTDRINTSPLLFYELLQLSANSSSLLPRLRSQTFNHPSTWKY